MTAGSRYGGPPSLRITGPVAVGQALVLRSDGGYGGATLPTIPTPGVNAPGLVAEGEDTSGTTQSVTQTATYLRPSVIIPAGVTRPVYLQGSATINGNTLATGTVTLTIAEVSNGVDAPISWSATVPSLAGGTETVNAVARDALPSGTPNGRARTFVISFTESAGTGTVQNSAQYPTRLQAIAE